VDDSQSHFYSKTSYLPWSISCIPCCLLKINMAREQRRHLLQMLRFIFSANTGISIVSAIKVCEPGTTSSGPTSPLTFTVYFCYYRQQHFAIFFLHQRSGFTFLTRKSDSKDVYLSSFLSMFGFLGGVVPTFYVCATEPTEILHPDQRM